jgi:hypothetical protein
MRQAQLEPETASGKGRRSCAMSEPKRLAACRCRPEEMTGASLQDRWSIAADQGC